MIDTHTDLLREKLSRLDQCLNEENEEAIFSCHKDLMQAMEDLSISEMDHLLSMILGKLAGCICIPAANRLYEDCIYTCGKIAKLVRFFYAMLPADESLETYEHAFHNLVSRIGEKDSVQDCNALLAQYGLAAVPDIILLASRKRNSKLYGIVAQQLKDIQNISDYMIRIPSDPHFESIILGYLKEAFEENGEGVPVFLKEVQDIHFEDRIESDIHMLTEKYQDEEVLSKKLEEYNEKYLDVAGAYHIAANLFQEAAYLVDIYPYVQDLFESIGDRCERETKYLSMCEAQYRATGKRPKYIDNTYDFNPVKKDEPKKDDNWINPPHDEKDDSIQSLDLPDPKKPTETKSSKLDDDEDDIPPKSKKPSGNIYNISYYNSFNKSRQKNISDSFNHARLHSDDISIGEDKSEEEIQDDWMKRVKDQEKIKKSLEKYHALESTPEDIKLTYLNSLKWNSERLKGMRPWVIMLDSQDDPPTPHSTHVGYRKLLLKMLREIADDRDIEYSGSLVVAGDPIDGLYEIELTKPNSPAVVKELRAAANHVIQSEITKHNKKSPKTSSKTLNEALELFDQMEELEEAIKGGDPNKDRPLGQRIYNRVEDFNTQVAEKNTKLDQGLRKANAVKDSVMYAPTQLVNVVKNFISDMKNRKEQGIKEDILKDRKLRLRVYDMMRSLVKTALPWAVLGPLWGTLFNMVALPIRGIKAGITAVRGGPHRDVTIEIRDELHAELGILDDMIQKAENTGNTEEKYKLMRQRERMEQEYLKIASKIHFAPDEEKIRRRGH